MSEKLQNLMASGKLLPSSDLAEDVVCAVKIDGVWMRCRIISFDEELAKISLIDVGNIISIKLDQIVCIEEPAFFKFSPPWLCRLWGPCPAGDPSKWSRGSADFMNEQIKKASAVYIQDYWNKIEEIEQEK